MKMKRVFPKKLVFPDPVRKLNFSRWINLTNRTTIETNLFLVDMIKKDYYSILVLSLSWYSLLHDVPKIFLKQVMN